MTLFANQDNDVIEKAIERRRYDLGGALQVGRVLPSTGQRMAGPFRPHPHIGLPTVTQLFAGVIEGPDRPASGGLAGRMKLPVADAAE